MAINRSVVPHGADVVHADRIYRALPISPAALHVAGDFTTYDISVWDDEGVEIYSNTGLAVSNGNPVYNTLQAWDRDAIGANFLHTLKQTDLAPNTFKGGRTYTTVYTLQGGATYGAVPVTFVDEVQSLAPL